MKRIVFLISMFVLHSVTNAYVFTLDVLKKWDRKQKNFQHIICFGDVHDKTQDVNAIHRQYIKDLAIRTKNTSKVIVEDISSANQYNLSHCNGMVINSRGGLLGGLANDMRIDGVHVCNVEYRYCRVAALCPLLNAQNNSMCLLQDKVAVKDIHKEVVREIKKVRNFKDCKELSVLYKKVARQVERAIKSYQFSSYAYTDVASFCKKRCYKNNMDEYVQQLCIFDTALLDMNILHEVVTTKAPYVFVVAGGTHTRNVIGHLENIGYKKVYSSDAARSTTPLQSLNVGNIVNSYVKKLPPAVDLRVVDGFVK